MFKKILIIIIIIILGVIGFNYFDQEKITTTQAIPKLGYEISLTHEGSLYVNKGEGDYSVGYNGGIFLSYDLKSQNFGFDFDYTIKNNGNDTLVLGDTGASYPPQPEELIQPLTDKFEKVGEWLGYNLYIEKEIKQQSPIFQEVYPGKVTAYMTLLSKDKSRVNYFDRFFITGSFDNDKDFKKQHKEFIKILKTMKIEKIER